ncbi:MAG TPA: orotidine-5'-phosphate decarboxylase [Candidatus Saccharimonadia bacterium]|nr:orotidine-5'-phosphate decarboxylase [Candidatus Saccharimonadia bacterium]
MKFIEKLNAAIKKNNSLVCVGLDSDHTKLPTIVADTQMLMLTFNKAIITATADLVCAYKPNSAFYEALGEPGIKQLKATCDFLRENYPDIPIILDAKRGDIGNTNDGYVSFVFDYLGVDALTLHPYLGKESLSPFLALGDKGCIILCRTSNPGAGELQDLIVDNQPLYQKIAKDVIEDWNELGNCLLVVGATYPKELAILRKMAPNMTFLVPGIGAQGGDLEAALKAGLTKDKRGLIINSARNIIFASSKEDYADVARAETIKLKKAINMGR